jgi:hypothetical protein
VTLVLALAAAVFLSFRLGLALGREDTDTSESPLMLSVARQLIAGPWELYGPFHEHNHLVLIHAPLYYRLAALLAWPLARAGLDVVSAARIAGRSLSMLGLLTTLAAAYRLAQLDGAPRRAGGWAVLLIAAAPVLASQPYAVRPDMLGVALQTLGVLLVLSALESPRPAAARLAAAYAAFGLALCVKQHFVVAPAISTGLLMGACWRGRLAWRRIERSVVLGVGIVVVVYGFEEILTGGRMWQSVFVAAGSVGRVHPADWLHVATVGLAVIGKSAGLIVLLGSAGLATVAVRPGLARWTFAAGAGLVGATVALLGLQLIVVDPWITGPLVVGVLAIASLIIPACAGLERSSFATGRCDHALWTYVLGEVALMLVLCRISTGAWINYATLAVVLAGVLTARALARALEGAVGLRPVVPVAMAVLAVLSAALMDIKEVASRRRVESAVLAGIFAHVGRSPSAYFFADRPGLNRVQGRLDLVYDDWLYPVFESLDLAEPRSRWLRQAISSGPVRVLVMTSDSPRLDGILETLPALGYLTAFRVGSFLVWTR